MGTLVDIQMPVKKGGFIVGDVIQRLLMQDVELTFYINASNDFVFPPGNEEMLKLIATSAENEARIRKSILTAFKRNKMRRLGTSPYVYLADPDVLLPDEPVLDSMVRGLERQPRLGAVGVCYQKGNHVSAGSMMLRRNDFLQIGELRGAGPSCICNYIANKLLEFGLYTVPLKTVRATHLKSEYDKEYSRLKKIKEKEPSHNDLNQKSKYSEYVEVEGKDVLSPFYEERSHGVLDKEKRGKKLEELIKQPDGAHFKLFIRTPSEQSQSSKQA